MAAKKRTGPKSGSAKPRKPAKSAATPPKAAPKVDNDNAKPPQATADQKVLALSNAVVGTLNGQDVQIALNALAAATARICLSTKTNSASFAQLLTAQIEVQAGLMLAEGQANAANAANAAKSAKGKRGGAKK